MKDHAPPFRLPPAPPPPKTRRLRHVAPADFRFTGRQFAVLVFISTLPALFIALAFIARG